MAPSLPNFLIVGAARSGTTGLYSHLRVHPEVFFPRRKEIHFFDHNWSKGLEWYQEHYADVTDEIVVGDATVSYMYEPEAVERMATVVPDARLIVTLRNPVDRAYSHYWMNRSQGRERLSFEEALAAEPERLSSGRGVSRRVPRRRWAYLDRGRYVHQLRRLQERYPPERILVLVFELDILGRYEQTYGEVCRFLGIDDTFVAPDLSSAVNRSIAFRSVTLARVSRRIRRQCRPLTPLTRAVDRRNEEPLTYPPMQPETRAELLRRFQADNAALASWLGRDVDVWER